MFFFLKQFNHKTFCLQQNIKGKERIIKRHKHNCGHRYSAKGRGGVQAHSISANDFIKDSPSLSSDYLPSIFSYLSLKKRRRDKFFLANTPFILTLPHTKWVKLSKYKFIYLINIKQKIDTIWEYTWRRLFRIVYKPLIANS